jgi:acetyl esterase/lipase
MAPEGPRQSPPPSLRRNVQELARAYIPPGLFGQPAANTDPCLHPALAPDDALRLFPPTSIMCGGLDPLLDDAVDFSTRLRRLGVPGELQVLRELPHGFLNFGHLPGVPGAVATLHAWVMRALGLAA